MSKIKWTKDEKTGILSSNGGKRSVTVERLSSIVFVVTMMNGNNQKEDTTITLDGAKDRGEYFLSSGRYGDCQSVGTARELHEKLKNEHRT